MKFYRLIDSSFSVPLVQGSSVQKLNIWEI